MRNSSLPNRLPQQISQFSPEQVRHDEPKTSANIVMQDRVRLWEQLLAWQAPLRSDTGVDDKSRQRERSSLCISSAERNAPVPIAPVRSFSSCRNTRARLRRSAAVGMFSFNKAIISAAIEVRRCRARSRNAL